ncbi:MAG TPA: DNA mismatch repair endonuclease MutL [Rectinemataceae bacterium]|nr:DNA mismatch repair endonuclease MutL [Rectinemataceae bacterium]
MATIHVLPPETARLIAAGEVIDRPAAALRELLDNAIDAGAHEISVRIEGGGIELISVSDDGSGMDREDLELSVLPHATSKIRSADDLLRTRSLGFRGEALASIAVAAQLEILTRTEDSSAACRLVAGPGTPTRLDGAAGRRGCTVTVRSLFEAYPARRQFLKRPQAEAGLCRQVFTDKAAAHPGLLFRYSSGQADAETLRPDDFAGRCAQLHPELPRDLLHSLAFSGVGFAGSLVIAGPAYSRTDRRLMQTFVNRRRVQDWSLLQALDYSFAEYLPGGAHPAAFLFVEVDPALADFNIHPAKREVRLKDPESLRRAVVSAIRSFLPNLARREPAQLVPAVEGELASTWEREHWTGEGAGFGSGWRAQPKAPGAGGERGAGWEDFMAARARGAPLPAPAARTAEFRYLGRALGPFLLFEMGDELWFLDQHAAHERIIFDGLAAAPLEIQTLLIPERIEAESDAEEAWWSSERKSLAEAGFALRRAEDGWFLDSAPAGLAGEAGRALHELWSGQVQPGQTLRAVHALSACRSAIKDGDEIGSEAAVELFQRSLALPEPRCPHGRPIWTRITRAQLYALVRRTL